MDNQNQQPTPLPGQPNITPTPNPGIQPTAAPIPAAPNTPPVPAAEKPKLAVSDDVAQSLLALNGMQGPPKKKLRLPIGMLITIGVIVVLLIAVSFLLNHDKTPQSSQSTNGSAGTSSSQDGDKQINQDVQSCSNIVNAVSEC